MLWQRRILTRENAMKEVGNRARITAAGTALCVTFSIVWAISSYAFSGTPQHLKPLKTGTVEVREFSPELDVDAGADH
jgi:hypothetical protein